MFANIKILNRGLIADTEGINRDFFAALHSLRKLQSTRTYRAAVLYLAIIRPQGGNPDPLTGLYYT